MLTVRPAIPADLDVIVAGNADMAAETEQLQLDLPTLRQGVAAVLEARAPGRYWVAEHEGRVVGQTAHHLRMERLAEPAGVVDPVGARRARGASPGRVPRARTPDCATRPGRPAPAGLRLYVDETNTRAQAVYAALGMHGGHYRVFEDMFAEPAKLA